MKMKLIERDQFDVITSFNKEKNKCDVTIDGMLNLTIITLDECVDIESAFANPTSIFEAKFFKTVSFETEESCPEDFVKLDDGKFSRKLKTITDYDVFERVETLMITKAQLSHHENPEYIVTLSFVKAGLTDFRICIGVIYDNGNPYFSMVDYFSN